MLKFTLAQINPTIGDIAGNIELMREAAEAAAAQGSELVVFPELSLTGYYPADMLDDPAFMTRVNQGLTKLRALSRETPDLVLVTGMPTANLWTGKRLYNSLVAIKNGEIVRDYHKQLLPTYDVFDERRHFEPGPDQAAVLTVGARRTRVGFVICEDAWNDEGNAYAVNPLKRLMGASPDIVVTINASPSNIGKHAMRLRMYERMSAKRRVPIVYVNQVGGHDQLVYDGNSFVVDPDAGLVVQAPAFEPALETLHFDPRSGLHDLSGEKLRPVRYEPPEPSEFYRRQLVLGLRDYARRCGFKQVVVGSSGGIDSAVTIALAVEALGAENVAAITMPSVYSSAGSITDSEALCKNLGVVLLTHPIARIVDAFSNGFIAMMDGREALEGVAAENLQARIRGTVLMAFSNQFGHLLLATGNKSEISVGYCTLYGDTNGGLGVIGDLYKTEVYALARHINETAGREIIPRTIIEKAPSAELAPGQKDTDSLPPYEILDEVLKLHIEGERLSPEELEHAKAVVADLEKTDEGRALVKRVHRMVARNEYKRRQAPPILRVRARAFGSGRQMPIAAYYE